MRSRPISTSGGALFNAHVRLMNSRLNAPHDCGIEKRVSRGATSLFFYYTRSPHADCPRIDDA